MESTIIRKAKREDCAEIRALIQELADFEQLSDAPKIDAKTLEEDGFNQQHPLFVCYVAECDLRLVGYALAYYAYSTWTGKAMYLEDLYVTQAHRKQQVGSRLLKAIAKEARNSDCSRLDLTVLTWNPARKFYEHEGAMDMTTAEGWYHYRFPKAALEKLANES